MKKLLLTILAAMASVCYADPPAPFPIEINSQSRVAPEVWTFRNNVRTFRATFKDGTNAVSLVGATPFMSWSTNELASGVVTSSWALVDSGTSGMADFTFTAAALNYATQTNVYEIGVAGSVAVYNRGRFLIKPSPYATGTNMPVFTTNQNLTGYSFTGQPWIENVTLTTGGSAYVWSGTGTTRNLNVPTGTMSGATGSGVTTNITVGGGSSTRLSVSNGATANPVLNFNAAGLATGTPLYVEAFTGSVGSAAGFATGTPLYVEAFTGSVGSVAGLATGTPLYVEAFTGSVGTIAGLATGTPLYVESFTGSVGSISGLATGTPLYVEADTNAIARLVAASNSLAARIVVTESYTGRAAVALSSSVWSLAESTTGYYSRVNGNLLDARLVVVESYTSRIVGVEAYTARVVALEGYTATVAAIQWQVNTNLTRLGALETNTTIVAGYVGTNDAYDITSTNPYTQYVLGDFEAGGVRASSRLFAASSALVGSELVTNGTFAAGTNTSADFWTLSLGSEWNSGSGGRVLVSSGSTATLVPSNRLGFAGRDVLWITYTNVLSWTGSIKVAVGGATNISAVTTGLVSFYAGTVNDSNLVITISSTNGQAGIDSVSVKAGRAVHGGVAGNWSVGGDLAANAARVGSLTTTGSVTAGSANISSNLNMTLDGAAMVFPNYIQGGFTNAPYRMKAITSSKMTHSDLVWLYNCNYSFPDGSNETWTAADRSDRSAMRFGITPDLLGYNSIYYSVSPVPGELATNFIFFINVSSTNVKDSAGFIAARMFIGGRAQVPSLGYGLQVETNMQVVGTNYVDGLIASANVISPIITASGGSLIVTNSGSSYLTIDRGSTNANDAYLWMKTAGASKWLSGIGSTSGDTSNDFRWISYSSGSPVQAMRLGYEAPYNLTLFGGKFIGDGSALTNLPAAATTAGVNGILVDATNTLTANVDFDDSVEIDPYQNGSNGVSWSINSGSIASGKLAAAVISWVGSKGTGTVGAAVNLGVTNAAAGTINGTYPNINIGTNDSQGSATGNLFRVESQSANLIVTTNNGPTASFTLSGVATGAPVNKIDAGANITVTRTGDTVNIVGSAGGGAQTPIATNIAYAGYTFSNASQGELVQVPTTNHVQAAGRVSFFDDRARQNDGAGAAGSVRTIPHISMVVDASNAAGWVSTVIRQTDNVPEFVMSGVSGPSSGYQPGFALSTASRAMVHNGGTGTARSSPGKTAGDEDVMIAVFRGVDEADVVIWGIPGTSADLTSATMQRLYTARYVEGGTGQNVFNLGKQDFDFTVSGQTTGFVLRVDASSDAVGIRQPGTWTASTAITGAALRVWGDVAIESPGGVATGVSYKLGGGGRLYDDGTNVWYANSTGGVEKITSM